MAGSTEIASSSALPPTLRHRQFDCSGCGSSVDFTDACCVNCKLPRPQKLIISNEDLANLILMSTIEKFSLDIDFLVVLLSQQAPSVVENSPQHDACHVQTNDNANSAFLPPVQSPRRLSSTEDHAIDEVVDHVAPLLSEVEEDANAEAERANSSIKSPSARADVDRALSPKAGSISPDFEHIILDYSQADIGKSCVDEGDCHQATETATVHEPVQQQPNDQVLTSHADKEGVGTGHVNTHAPPTPLIIIQPLRKKTNRNIPRAIRKLRDHIPPGLHDLAPEPIVYSNLMITSRMTRACLELESDLARYFNLHFPEYANEMIKSDIVYPRQCIASAPSRIEAGYFKAHLTSQFVMDFFDDCCLPRGMRVKRKANQKAIAFISTTQETLSNTHYDQDPSFLFVLKGMKQMMYASPSVCSLYEKFRVVESHSSIFEGVNPFKDQCAGWEGLTLTAGDGLMLPQNWLHAVKSSPGTLAISFQVESTGEVKSRPDTSKTTRRRSSPLLFYKQPSKKRERSGKQKGMGVDENLATVDQNSDEEQKNPEARVKMSKKTNPVKIGLESTRVKHTEQATDVDNWDNVEVALFGKPVKISEMPQLSIENPLFLKPAAQQRKAMIKSASAKHVDETTEVDKATTNLDKLESTVIGKPNAKVEIPLFSKPTRQLRNSMKIGVESANFQLVEETTEVEKTLETQEVIETRKPLNTHKNPINLKPATRQRKASTIGVESARMDTPEVVETRKPVDTHKNPIFLKPATRQRKASTIGVESARMDAPEGVERRKPVDTHKTIICLKPATRQCKASTIGESARPRKVQGNAKILNQVDPSTVVSGGRKSKRVKLMCGMNGCSISFPANGLMWMLIRKDVISSEKLLPSGCPVVPKDQDKHLVCFDCEPQMGREILNSGDVLDDDDKARLEGWEHYVYCPASRGDYMAQADQSRMF